MDLAADGSSAASANAPAEGRSEGGVDWIISAILFIGAVALYARTVRFDFVNFDDFKYVTQNPHMRLGLSWAGIRWAFTTAYFPYWHPITWLAYLAMTSIFGAQPGPLHALNFTVHALTACLLYRFLFKTTGARWPAALAAAIFAWHPLRVESVAWIAETKDVLAGFFWMLTLIVYERYTRRPNWKMYAAVTLTYFLALGAKPTVVTLPTALLLLDFWPLGRAARMRGGAVAAWGWLAMEKVPWLLLAALVSGLAYHIQNLNGALNLNMYFPLHIRLENAAVSTARYVTRNFWPHDLALFYPHPAMIGQAIPAWQWGGAAALIVAATCFVIAARRRAPFLAVGWFWFLGTLVPMIGIIQAGEQAMADRHSLIPSIGLIVAVVWSAAALVKRRRAMLPGVIAIALLAVVGLWTASWIQIGYWRNTETIFAHTNEVTRDNYLARAILANCYSESPERAAQALALARSAAVICPTEPYPHHILAGVLQKQGKNEEALVEYQAAINQDRYDAETRDDVGRLLAKMGRDKDAIVQFRRASSLDPLLADPHQNVAVILASQNKLDEASAEMRIALQLAPEDGKIHGTYADLLQLRGDRRGALQQYRAAIAAGETKPEWETNLAWLIAIDPRAESADIDRALTLAEDAVKRTPENKSLSLDALAAALARVGRFDDAVAAATQAVTASDAEKRSQLSQQIRSRLQMYQSGQPYLRP